MGSSHWSDIPSLFQIKLMSLWIADTNVSPTAWISYAENWSLSGDLYFYNIAIGISTTRQLAPAPNCSAVCMTA
jgi:hypothetical protein